MTEGFTSLRQEEELVVAVHAFISSAVAEDYAFDVPAVAYCLQSLNLSSYSIPRLIQTQKAPTAVVYSLSTGHSGGTREKQ